ncbi:MAG: hypothetical protein AAGF85_21425 [Bacteroidota bacterium]
MKLKKTLLVCLWLGVLTFQNTVIAQSLAESRHHVIIGAFTSETNAECLTAKAIKLVLVCLAVLLPIHESARSFDLEQQ